MCWWNQPNSQRLTKVRVVSLVEEQLVAHSLHNDVPGVDWARAAHQGGQDGISGEHIALGLSQLGRQKMRPLIRNHPTTEKLLTGISCFYLADDWIIGGGNSVEDPLDAFQLLFVAGGDPIKSLIVVLQSATAFAAGNRKEMFTDVCISLCRLQFSFTYMSTGSDTSMYLIFISLGKSISSFTSQSLLTSTEESLGFSWACDEQTEDMSSETLWQKLIFQPLFLFLNSDALQVNDNKYKMKKRKVKPITFTINNRVKKMTV